MNVALSQETTDLLEARMKDGDYASPDELIRVALSILESGCVEDLPSEVRQAIEQAEAEADRGEGMPVDEAFGILRRKYSGS